MPQSSHGHQFEALLQLQAQVLGQDSLPRAATAFATELCALISASRCIVGVVDGKDLKIRGSSGLLDPDPSHLLAQQAVAAMEECLEAGRSLGWPPVKGQPRAAVVLSQRQFAGSGACMSVPLAVEAQPVGALVLVRETSFSEDEQLMVQDAAMLAAPLLALQQRASRGVTWLLGQWVSTKFQRLRAQNRRWIALVLVGLVCWLPVSWRVTAPARLEGAVQRALVAASDGYVQQVNARPGDSVREGQVIAELANRDLEVERQRRESELRQHETAYQAAQARYDRSAMVAAQAKAAETRALLQLAEANLERSRAVAPFDGIVVKGDLAQNLGAPVQRGDVLAVIAPADRFRLVLEVDERDVAQIRPGLKGDLVLASQPGRSLAFTVARIVPVSIASDGLNHFDVEGRLDVQDPALRPGLAGIAKVRLGTRPLAAVLLARAWGWARFNLWAMLP